jgi:nucleoside-diphosphate-sugar epimerase
MKTILLTGSNGFLGRIIYNELHNKCNLLTLARSKANICIDLSESIPQITNVDIIVHCLGKAHDLNYDNFSYFDYYKNNVLATSNLLEGLDKNNLPSSFIYISTVSVYGKTFGVNITEDHPLEAKDPYGLSKIQTEMLLLKWSKLHNINLIILRLPLLIGENPVGNYKSLISAIKHNLYFNIQNLDVKKSYLLASDIAINILNFANYKGVYNLTDGSDITITELSNAIALKLNKPLPLKLPFRFLKSISLFGDYFGKFSPINSRKFDKLTQTLTFSNKKAINILQWTPTEIKKNLTF